MMITDTYAKSGEDFEVVDFDFFHWVFMRRLVIK